jgi:hypothetical protein
MQEKMRKYLLYGVGEILLIIIGILIALQIDNWNTERQQEMLLSSYLDSIARNMSDDVREIEELRDRRSSRFLDAMRGSHLLGRIDYSYDVSEIYFFNKHTAEASQNLYFNADTSGYEALKTSGVMGLLQGSDVEQLLSTYYDQVSHIEDLETRHNELINSLNIQFLLSYPDSVVQVAFREPRAMARDRFQELQPSFAAIINGAAVRELVNLQVEASAIVREYDRLMQLGTAFVSLVKAGSMSFDDPEIASILNNDQIDESALYADLVTDGQLSMNFYTLNSVADRFENIFKFHAFERVGDGIRFYYPGSNSWAAIWLQFVDYQEDRPVRDFSRFDKLVLELKADSGSETIDVHIKDRFLPDTEPPESVELQLGPAWQTYEIDLERFENTDLSNLMTPLGFTFLQEPQSFSLRNARYVTAD